MFLLSRFMSIVKTKEDKIGFSMLNSVRIVNSILKVFWKTGSDDIDYGSINLFGYIDYIDYGNIFWSYLKSIHLQSRAGLVWVSLLGIAWDVF
jgi:hypothetical protein